MDRSQGVSRKTHYRLYDGPAVSDNDRRSFPQIRTIRQHLAELPGNRWKNRFSANPGI